MFTFFKQPLVSVIIASYNHAAFVYEAITSVLNQSVQDIEVIIVDDGSTDETDSIIASIHDPRIRFIPLKNNRAKHPRNIGLSKARGRYIAFQNSDDVWHPHKLEEQLISFKNNINVSVSFTGVDIINHEGIATRGTWADALFETENNPQHIWLRRFFDNGNCFCISSALIDSKKLRLVGNFNPILFNLSDFDLWVRLACVGDFDIIPEKLTSMRIIERKNLSSPSPHSLRRVHLEFIEVLNRYTHPLFLPLFKDVFKDLYDETKNSSVGLLGTLATYSWEKDAHYVWFGNSIIESILKDERKRAELVSLFGTNIIHKYIQKRGDISLSLDNTPV